MLVLVLVRARSVAAAVRNAAEAGGLPDHIKGGAEVGAVVHQVALSDSQVSKLISIDIDRNSEKSEEISVLGLMGV